MSWPPE